MKKTKRVACVLFLAVVLLLGSNAAHASSDSGFIIRIDGFSLTVRVNLAELEFVDGKSADEMINSGSLFFDCMRWVHVNQRLLGRTEQKITVWWDLQNRRFSIVDSKDLEYTQVKYRTGQAAEKLLRKLEKMLRLQREMSVGRDSVPLYVVRSKEYIDAYLHSDVYFGSIPSYMYSNSEENYVFLMWSWDPASSSAKELHNQGATVEAADMTRANIYSLLGNLE